MVPSKASKPAVLAALPGATLSVAQAINDAGRFLRGTEIRAGRDPGTGRFD
jgi:hypothetical protein